LDRPKAVLAVEVDVHAKIVASTTRCHDVERTAQFKPRRNDGDDKGFAIVNCSSLASTSSATVPLNVVGDHIGIRVGGDHGTQHYMGSSEDIAITSFKATEDEELMLIFSNN
jgi:hypothetical protein